MDPNISNMANWRGFQLDRILEAFQAKDWPSLEEFAEAALADPFLPVFHRAQYELFMAYVNRPMIRIDRALEHIQEMEHRLAHADETRTSDDPIAQLRQVAEWMKEN